MPPTPATTDTKIETIIAPISLFFNQVVINFFSIIDGVFVEQNTRFFLLQAVMVVQSQPDAIVFAIDFQRTIP